MSRTHKYAAEPVPEEKQLAAKKQDKLWTDDDINLIATLERKIYGDIPLIRKLEIERRRQKERAENGRIQKACKG